MCFVVVSQRPLWAGRHAGEFHDFLISGQFTQWEEGTFESKKYTRGSDVFHGRWRGSVVELDADTWMLEHMTGIIPLSLPFGLADSLMSNLDVITVYKSMTQYARLTIKEIFRYGKI